MGTKTQSFPDPIKWGEVTFGDTTVTIYATEATRDDGITGVEFKLEVNGQGDISGGSLLGFFIDFENEVNERPLGDIYSGDGNDNDDWLAWSDESVLFAGSNANNMNGTAANDSDRDPNNPFDIGVQLSDVGTADGNLESTTFTIYGFSLEDLDGQTFGLRLQNTPNEEGSLKLVGTFIKSDCPSDLLYQGFTRGSWLNGARSDDLTGLFNGEPQSYETLFLQGNTHLTFTLAGRNGDILTFDDPTLKEALGLTGGGINQLAAQSTAAYLNALYLENDGDPLTAYSLTKEVVKDLTAAVLNEGNLGGTVDLGDYWWYKDTNGERGFQEDDMLVFGSTDMGKEELTQLFDFYNNFGTNPAEFMLNPSPPPLVV
jgi:hypothetical protein